MLLWLSTDRLRTLPLLGDFGDRRGDVKPDRGFADFLKSALPTVLLSVPATIPAIRDLLTPMPLAAIVAKAALPMGLFLLSILAVTLRRSEAVVDGIIIVDQPAKRWVYRFTSSSRLAAKIAFAPLFILTGLAIRDLLPLEWWSRETTVSGYVCLADRSLRDINVDILDAYGSRIVTAHSDDTGWIDVDIPARSRRPAYLRFLGAACDKDLLPLAENESTRNGCPSDPDGGNYERHLQSRSWRAPCH